MQKTRRQGGALFSILIACAVGISVLEIHAQSVLPSGWQARDIGGPAIAGSTSESSGTWTISAGGTNVWDTADQFQFAYTQISGDTDISVRIASFTMANDWSKAGIMIRESLNPDARNVYVLNSRGTGPALQQRGATGGSTTRTNGTGAVPGWVRLVRSGNQFTAYSSTNGTSWTTVATATVNMTASVFAGLAVSSRDANASTTATFSNLQTTAGGSSSATALPAPWANTDIGSPALSGSTTSPSSDSFSVTGAGSDIWYSADQFQFVYQPVQGDAQIVARVASIQATDGWSKGGVMIRQSLTAGSQHASVFGTPSNGWTFQWRSSANSNMFYTLGPSGAPPGWVKLTRVGNVITGYVSSDGATWTQVDSEPITMSGTIYVGLAVTSHNANARATDSFTNVAVTTPSNQAPSASITSPASGATFTAPANITINATASDSDGTVAQVDFYRDSTLIGSDTTSPYSATWSNAAAGSYQLTAVARDNGGATKTSTAVNVTVNGAANQLPSVSITSPTSGTSFTAPANITISASASDTDGTIAGVDFYSGTTLLGTDTTSPYSWAWNNVAAGSYSVTAVARDNGGASRTSTAVSVTVSAAAAGLPSPWTNADIGAPALSGSASSPSAGTFTVTGAGSDIWNSADQFQFVYQPVSGDTQIVARVQNVQATDAWSKGGVMIRQALTAGSQHASMFGTGSSGWSYQYRTSANAYPGLTAGPSGSAPGWVKLARVGNVFTASVSSDGAAWTQVGSQTITMTGTVYVGLAVTSHNANARATDTFTNVAVTGVTGTNQPPTVAITSPTSGATFTAPANITLNASASDPDGTITAVDFLNGSQIIATDTTSPYSASWTNVGAGTYNLTAVARDNGGASRTSSTVTVTVNGTVVTTTVIFTASADHATNVTSYVVAIYRAADNPSTASPVATRDIGKPTPAANGDITADISTLVNPLAAGSYKVVVRAVGPGGTTASVPSSTFTK